MHSELQPHVVRYRCILHEREVEREQVSQCFRNLEHKEAQLRAQLQTEQLMMTSMMESFQETSERERQAAISAQVLAAVLRSEMSQETTACHS